MVSLSGPDDRGRWGGDRVGGECVASRRPPQGTLRTRGSGRGLQVAASGTSLRLRFRPPVSSAADVPSARAAPAGATAPGGTWLARLLPQLPAVRWIALVRAELTCWPPETVPPRGTLELARRAVATGRVLRAALEGDADGGDGVDELIAVPSRPGSQPGSRPGTADAAAGAVLLVGASACDERSRQEIVRRLRAVLDAGGDHAGEPGCRPDHPPPPPPPVPARVTAVPTPSRAAVPPSSRADPPSDLAGELPRLVLAAVAGHTDGDGREVDSCALALADAVATLADCRRVSVGVRRGGAVRLLAISGEARPDRRRALARRLEAAMAEALALGEGGVWPPAEPVGTADARRELRAHRELHEHEGGLPLCSLVHESASGARLVALFERSAARPIDTAWRAAIAREVVPALGLAGALETTRASTRSRLTGALRETFEELRRGRPSRRAALAALAALALLGGALVPLPYRVSARVVIEASDRQVLAAPHAGHMRSAHARAGDTVLAGTLLATLDERELVLARERWDGEAASNRAARAQALAGRDRVELARLGVDAARIAAERALVEERRARGELRAPFDGVVLSGDPGRALGAPVAAGEVVFEIAASERRSLLIEVDEHDVALIERGAAAEVRMAAAPRRALDARLGAVVPVAVAEPGGSVFRVPATLADEAAGGELLRPGMQGVARIDAGRRSLLDAWTRGPRERLLLLAWKLGLVR